MEIQAQKRTILGAKVRQLRRDGIIPGSVYGKKTPSLNLQLNLLDFLKVYAEAGDTKVVDLILDKKKYSVLIHQIHYHPVDAGILSVDFLAVDLNEAIRVSVPIVSVGTPTVVAEKLGALLQPQKEIEVECLPSDLPENIQIDVTSLSNVGDSIKVSDIKVPAKVKVLSDSDLVVFTITDLIQKEKVEEVETPHEAEATAQKKVEEGAASEDDAASTESKKEVKKDDK